jgi:hypothetical protein
MLKENYLLLFRYFSIFFLEVMDSLSPEFTIECLNLEILLQSQSSVAYFFSSFPCQKHAPSAVAPAPVAPAPAADTEDATVLKHNKLIDNIAFNDENAEKYLVNNFFDIVINLDLAHESLSLTKLSNKSKILGSTIDNNRAIVPSNDFA